MGARLSGNGDGRDTNLVTGQVAWVAAREERDGGEENRESRIANRVLARWRQMTRFGLAKARQSKHTAKWCSKVYEENKEEA